MLLCIVKESQNQREKRRVLWEDPLTTQNNIQGMKLKRTATQEYNNQKEKRGCAR